MQKDTINNRLELLTLRFAVTVSRASQLSQSTPAVPAFIKVFEPTAPFCSVRWSPPPDRVSFPHFEVELIDLRISTDHLEANLGLSFIPPLTFELYQCTAGRLVDVGQISRNSTEQPLLCHS